MKKFTYRAWLPLYGELIDPLAECETIEEAANVCRIHAKVNKEHIENYEITVVGWRQED
jgi:hypothetical protein